MGKLPVLLLLPLTWASVAHAQQGTFRYGVKGGFSLGTYAGRLNGPYDAGYKPGFAAGALATYGLADHASVQLEVLYSRKGVFADNYRYYQPAGSTTTYSTVRYRATLSYLDVPLLLKLNSGSAGSGVFLELGPQLSFALGQREQVASFGSTSTPIDQTLSTDRGALTPVCFGYVGGIGYQFGFGLGLGVRYTGDASHVYTDEGGPGSSGVATSSSFHNSVFQVQAHYLFGGKQ